MKSIRYNNLYSFYKRRFGEKLAKIPIDGGFTCPNRDGKVGFGGCIFCGERGAGEHLKKAEISEQVKEFISKKQNSKFKKFVAYFQNFTNTYAPVDVLRQKYDSALVDDRIVAMGIGTRPDCIDEQVASLLAEYNKRLYVFVELGLQTSDNDTLKFINRNHTKESFEQACRLLNAYGVDVVAHVMVGLPGESFEHLKNTVDFINKQKIQGIKIHSLYILANTELNRLYQKGEYTPITRQQYIDAVCYILTRIKPNIVIHRLISDYIMQDYVAPDWSGYNVEGRNKLLLDIDRKLERENLFQGCFYNEE